MFWSGETLAERLPTLIDPFYAERVDCAAYTLTIGPEIYVSPNEQAVDPTTVTVRNLKHGEFFTIPPGQFAFILTEEIVEIPADAIAFISIRAKTKFRGLINVSGFHVDPGYRGQLTFAVFNAGPAPIHLKRGQPSFLIWYADLDRPSEKRKKATVPAGIDPQLVTSIAGELQSLTGLSNKVKEIDKTLGNRIHAIERDQAFFRILAVVVPVLLSLAGSWLINAFGPAQNKAVPVSNAPAIEQPTDAGR